MLRLWRYNVKIANNGRPMIIGQVFFDIEFLPKDNGSYCGIALAWKNIQGLREIKEHADVAWLSRHGNVYAAMQPI